MSTSLLQTDPHPIREDDKGTLRVGNSRMTIDIVIGDYNEGASAEEIARRYPPLPLSDIYGVIWYYLRHKEDIARYLAEREREAEEAMRLIESQRTPEQLQLIERIRAARRRLHAQANIESSRDQ